LLYLALGLLVIFIIIWTSLTRIYGSGWIKTGTAYGVNSLIGYSYTEGGEVVHKENRSFIQQVSLFSGATTDVVDKFYLLRPVYAYLASLLAPLFGIYGALLAMNILGWLIAGLVTWRLAMKLTNDQTVAMLATLLVAIGTGFVIHVGDFSAHLWSFTFYYVGILVLYESGIWKQAREWQTHFAIGCFLALDCLEYNTGIVLVLAYVIMSLRHNKLFIVILTTMLALSAQYLWLLSLNIGYALTSGQWHWYDLYGVEREYLSGSLETWLWLLISDPTRWLAEITGKTVEFLSFDFLLLTATGIIGVAVAVRRNIHKTWPLLLMLTLPIVGSMAYAQRAAARGYLVYGISIILYIYASWLLVQIYRKGGMQFKAIAIVLGLAITVGQLLWVAAPFTGQTAPIRAYYNGVQHSVASFASGPATMLGISGHSVTPGLFGGKATMEEAGAYSGGGTVESRHGIVKRIVLAMGIRSLASFYLICLLALYLYQRNNKIQWSVLYALAIIFVFPSLVLATTIKNKVIFFNADEAGPGTVCKQVKYSVNLSDEFLARWDESYQQGMTMQIYFRPVAVRGTPGLYLNNQPVNLARTDVEGLWQVEPETWRSKIDKSGTMLLTYYPEGPVKYLGWQRSNLAGRKISLAGCNEKHIQVNVLPALEIRLKHQQGPYRLIGF